MYYKLWNFSYWWGLSFARFHLAAAALRGSCRTIPLKVPESGSLGGPLYGWAVSGGPSHGRSFFFLILIVALFCFDLIFPLLTGIQPRHHRFVHRWLCGLSRQFDRLVALLAFVSRVVYQLGNTMPLQFGSRTQCSQGLRVANSLKVQPILEYARMGKLDLD